MSTFKLAAHPAAAERPQPAHGGAQAHLHPGVFERLGPDGEEAVVGVGRLRVPGQRPGAAGQDRAEVAADPMAQLPHGHAQRAGDAAERGRAHPVAAGVADPAAHDPLPDRDLVLAGQPRGLEQEGACQAGEVGGAAVAQEGPEPLGRQVVARDDVLAGVGADQAQQRGFLQVDGQSCRGSDGGADQLSPPRPGSGPGRRAGTTPGATAGLQIDGRRGKTAIPDLRSTSCRPDRRRCRRPPHPSRPRAAAS